MAKKNKSLLIKVLATSIAIVLSACAASQKQSLSSAPISVIHPDSQSAQLDSQSITPQLVDQNLLIGDWQIVNGVRLQPKCNKCDLKSLIKHTPLGPNHILTLKADNYEWQFLDLSSRRQSFYPWSVSVKDNTVVVDNHARNQSVSFSGSSSKKLEECAIELIDYQAHVGNPGVEDSNEGFKLQVWIECSKAAI